MPTIQDLEQFLPWDKSQIIRFAFLDLIADLPERSIQWLADHHDELGDDLQALLQSLKDYLESRPIDVQESETLLVFWRYFLWVRDDPREIITSGTLTTRSTSNDSRLVQYSVDELLGLQDRTSKWASIAVLHGKNGHHGQMPPHLQLTHQTKWQWQQATERGEMWQPRKDKVITECIEAYLVWLESGVMPLDLDNPEKMCQAMAFELVTPDEALALWPSIQDHESNRPVAMRAALENPFWVESDDHRVVMAMAMRFVPYQAFSNPDCVSKSFPLFWDMMATL